MKISHVITSIDKSTGGPARSVTHLIQAMLNANPLLKIHLETLKCQNPIIDTFKNSNGNIHFNNFGLFGFSKQLQANLKSSGSNLFHGHGLWQMPVHQMAKQARKANVPYIITPRGMLDTWSIKHKGLKKKLALLLFQNRDIKHAHTLHATSKSEAENIRALGFKNPIAFIPNGINLPSPFVKKKSSSKKQLLFLSRLVKNKGVEELLQAWSLLNDKTKQNWELIIVGDGDLNYIEKLKGLKEKLNLSDVTFKDPCYGSEKQELFKEASLFVLPSYTENFGMVIAEALSFQVPVITTKGTPWQDLVTHKCGWWIDIGVEPLKNILEEALPSSTEQLNTMGLNGRKLIENKYSIESVAKDMIKLYDWVITKGEKPKFVTVL